MQNSKPDIEEDLERVGVAGLRTIVVTEWKGKEYRFVPEIELVIDLDKKRKGVHMSRLVEAITESIEEESMIRHGSLEELERDMLERLKK
ncbi:MAG: GTP cyclohydrolase I FolE2, partial [Candidatus Altiarchaeales archaeon]|nr:GTP cyclohydrolase I FolE2 [Candidatus Altiarchaeales archaeon]